jgi:putative redox protein
LVLHSPQDTTVGIENAAQIFKDTWHPKSFISLDGADYLLSKKEDSIYVGKMISNWT